MSNRAPGVTWGLRALNRWPNGFVFTRDDDHVEIEYYHRPGGYPDSLILSRGDARLLAKRINECLDATVKK